MTTREEMDTLAKLHGWESADSFLGYAQLHSQTERALFNGEQIGLALALSGEDLGRAEAWFQAKGQWRSVDLTDLVNKAYERMKA